MKKLIKTAVLVAASIILAVSCGSDPKPLIGIAGSLSASGTVSCGASYMEAIVKAGGIPVVLPEVKDEATAEEVLSRVDGLLLTGGEDYNPQWYGETPVNGTVKINFRRDTTDIMMARTAASMGKQILGICRGVQTLNVALGGSLWQDIPSQYDTVILHKQKNPSAEPSHLVALAPDSRLRAIFGIDTIAVNSLHHEALKDIAPCLKVVGTASDGIVEAVEGKGIIGIQFHPEKMLQGGDESLLPIFTDFIGRCR